MFDKGYAYKAPFTFKLTSSNPYSLTLNSKAEFVNKEKGLGIDWEHKFRHERNSVAGSLLCSNTKVETEVEFWPWARKFGMLRGKAAIKPTISLVTKETLFPHWDMYGEAEFKYHGIKRYFATIKLVKDFTMQKPTLKFTSLYKFKPNGVIAGASCTVDSAVPQAYLSSLEFLTGLMPRKDILVYLKHTAANLCYPGKITAGLFQSGSFEVDWPKKEKEGTKMETHKLRIQGAMELSLDLVDKNKIAGKIGTKVMTKEAITLQTMLDNDLKWTTALTYHPKKFINFILSEQVDLQKFKSNPKGGFYNCGFTIELLC